MLERNIYIYIYIYISTTIYSVKKIAVKVFVPLLLQRDYVLKTFQRLRIAKLYDIISCGESRM